MPGPESETDIVILPSLCLMQILTSPLLGVYFIAFDNRLYTIVSTLFLSKAAMNCLSKGVNERFNLFCSASVRKSSYTLRTIWMISHCWSESRALPVLILRNSISSLTRRRSRVVPLFTICIVERWLPTCSPLFMASSLFTAPSMIANGVRNSWAMLVKKLMRKSVIFFSISICCLSSKLCRHWR